MQDADEVSSGGATAPLESSGKRPATMREVASLAGVSHQTVSRFVNKDTGMRPETVARIKKAMSELNYSPNLAARALRSHRNFRIVVMAPDVSQYLPIYVLGKAVGTAQLAGFQVDVMALEGTSMERMKKMESMLAGDDLAGVLSFIPLPTELALESTVAARVPVVISGSYDDKMRTSGRFADATAIFRIMNYLYGLGHRDFFHVAGPAHWNSASNRLIAYEKAVSDLGVRSHGSEHGDWSADSGYRIANSIVASSDVTAVVSANDQMALGVMRALHDNGIVVPRDVSVFGWDNMAEAKYFVPSLSSVRMDLEAQGSQGMARLISLIRGEPLDPEYLSAPAMDLVFRESCAPVRHRTRD